MSLTKELNRPHPVDDVLVKEREKMKILMTKNDERKLERRLSLTQVFNESDFENWKKNQSEELDALKKWYSKQPHLPENVTDQLLLTLLHSCSNSVEQTKFKIDSYFTIRTHAPEMFSNRSISSKEMQLARKIT